MSAEERRQEKRFHFRFLHRDLLIDAIALGGAAVQFQPIERAFARPRFALVRRTTPIRPRHIRPPTQQGQQRSHAQLVVILQVFVAQRQTKDALLDQFLDRVMSDN